MMNTIWRPTGHVPGLKIVTPQQFGARADGVTDDTTPLLTALQSGGTVVLPKGVYKVDTANATATLNADTRIIGEPGAIIRQTNTTSNYFRLSLSAGVTAEVIGVVFDANDVATAALFVYSSSSSNKPRIVLRDCVFENARMTAANKYWVEASGLIVKDSFAHVGIYNCIARNITRDAGVNDVGSNGSAGISVSWSGSLYTEDVIIQGCLIDTVTTDDSSGSNDQDCDGLKLFAPTSETMRASVRDCVIRDCKGKYVKVQTSGLLILDGLLCEQRTALYASGATSFTGLNLQYSHGTIRNCRMRFLADPPSGYRIDPVSGYRALNTTAPWYGLHVDGLEVEGPPTKPINTLIYLDGIGFERAIAARNIICKGDVRMPVYKQGDDHANGEIFTLENLYVHGAVLGHANYNLPRIISVQYATLSNWHIRAHGIIHNSASAVPILGLHNGTTQVSVGSLTTSALVNTTTGTPA